jgi:hypothetical protein
LKAKPIYALLVTEVFVRNMVVGPSSVLFLFTQSVRQQSNTAVRILPSVISLWDCMCIKYQWKPAYLWKITYVSKFKCPFPLIKFNFQQ